MAMVDLGGARLVTAYQVHSPDVVEVRRPWAREDAPKADAMVTRERGLALGILTADCVPVLFAEAEAGRAANLAVREGVQMHGGIGMTDEYDIGLYMKRDRALAEYMGDEIGREHV